MRYLLALFILLCAVPAFAATATLTWIDNSTNEKNFNIERKNEVCAANVLPWAEISVVTENVVTYKDIALPEGASYCYRVAASNPAGKSLWSNTAGLTVPFTIPAAPSLLGATSGP